MNKLVKILFLEILFIAFGQQVFSQKLPKTINEPKALNRIEAQTNRIDNSKQNGPGTKILLLKEKFISNKLNLTEEQSKAFTPLYRQYQEEIMKVRTMIRLNTSITSTSGTQNLDNQLAFEEQLVTIRKHYKDEFLKILPPEKVAEIYKSEGDFNKEVLKQLTERSIRSGD